MGLELMMPSQVYSEQLRALLQCIADSPATTGKHGLRSTADFPSFFWKENIQTHNPKGDLVPT